MEQFFAGQKKHEVKNVFLVIKIIAIFYVLLLIVVYAGQRFIIFQPDNLAKNHVFSFDNSFEEYFLEREDGVQINYLYFKSLTESKGLLLYFHGNKNNLQRWGQYQDDFIKRGYDVLIPDYRGYGKSDGKVSEKETYKDAFALYQLVKETWPSKELIIYGRSLGAGVATDLAAKVPAKMLLLENPFNNIPSLFQDQLFIWLPFKFAYQFPNDQNLKEVTCPVYIFHGTSDRVVPYRNAERLKDVLKKDDAFFTIEGGTHHNLNTFSIYQDNLDRLLGLKIIE